MDRFAPDRRITLGADRGYDVARFIAAQRARRVTSQIEINEHVAKWDVLRNAGDIWARLAGQYGRTNDRGGKRLTKSRLRTAGSAFHTGRNRTQQQHDVSVLRLVEDLADAPVLDDATAVHHRDGLGELAHERQVVEN